MHAGTGAPRSSGQMCNSRDGDVWRLVASTGGDGAREFVVIAGHGDESTGAGEMESFSIVLISRFC